MSHLTSVTITFYTPIATDDKKETTTISVFVCDVNRIVVAQKIHFAADLFPDDGSFSPVFDLVILRNIDKTDFLHGSFDVIITPRGGDSWVFIPYLLLKYSDGSSTSYDGYDNRIVSELATKTTFVF